MPKKTTHRRRVVKKSPPKEIPEKIQEEVSGEGVLNGVTQEIQSVQANQIQTNPNQVSDAGPQTTNVSFSPQSISVAEPEPEITTAPGGEGEGVQQKLQATNVDDSAETEREISEPIVAKDESGRGRNFLEIVLSIIKYLLIFALGASVGGFVVYQNGGKIDFINKTLQKKELPQKVEVTPAAIEPTEKPVNLTKYSIRILNGSERLGEASRLRNSLEEDGFKVSSIGNASESSFLKTIIMAKSDVDESFIEKLKDVLRRFYELDKTEKLKDSAEDDVEIIIGSEHQ